MSNEMIVNEEYFIVRIELHNANESDYDNLYLEMKKEGFKKNLKYDGKKYHLPRAEYITKSNDSKTQILESVKKTVSKIISNYSILVIEIKGFTWFNLEPIQ